MFFGRGFDTDGDGDSDLFVGGNLSPNDFGVGAILVIAGLCLISILLNPWLLLLWALIFGPFVLFKWLWSVCDYYGYRKDLAVVWLGLAITCLLGISYLRWSSWTATQQRLQKEAAIKAEQEKAEREHQERLDRIFNRTKK